MLKILKARLQQYMNHELLDIQAGFRKGRGTRDQIANIRWIIEKQESSRKTSISALLTMPNPLTVWITINCMTLCDPMDQRMPGFPVMLKDMDSERDGNTRPPGLPLEKSVCRSGSNS